MPVLNINISFKLLLYIWHEMKDKNKQTLKKYFNTFLLALLGVFIILVVVYGSQTGKTMDLFSQLIIAVLGFIAPIVALLFSIFHKGIIILKDKLLKQIEKDKKELKSEGEIPAIKEKIKELEKNKKDNENKIKLLDLKVQIKYLFLPFFLSLLFICSYYYVSEIIIKKYPQFAYFEYIYSGIALLTASLFGLGIYRLWKLICILIEVKNEIEENGKEKDEEKKLLFKDNHTEMMGVLNTISKKEPTEVVEVLNKIWTKGDLPANGLKIYIDGINIIEKTYNLISIPINSVQEFKVQISNVSTIMLKNVELAISVPNEFELVKLGNYTKTPTENKNILREEYGKISSKTNQQFDELRIKGTKLGTYKITIFCKAENIQGKIDGVLNIIVSDKTGKEIRKQ